MVVNWPPLTVVSVSLVGEPVLSVLSDLTCSRVSGWGKLLLPISAQAFFGAAYSYDTQGTVLWGPVTFETSACTVRVLCGCA